MQRVTWLIIFSGSLRMSDVSFLSRLSDVSSVNKNSTFLVDTPSKPNNLLNNNNVDNDTGNVESDGEAPSPQIEEQQN